jgi:hypothetical protein
MILFKKLSYKKSIYLFQITFKSYICCCPKNRPKPSDLPSTSPSMPKITLSRPSPSLQWPLFPYCPNYISLYNPYPNAHPEIWHCYMPCLFHAKEFFQILWINNIKFAKINLLHTVYLNCFFFMAFIPLAPSTVSKIQIINHNPTA